MDDYAYASLRFSHPALGRVAPLQLHGVSHVSRPPVPSVPAHPTDSTMMAWFTTARGDDLDDTLERAAHQALTEFCECHLSVLGDTAIALLPVQNESNMV
jgi:hypothetical protein